MYPLLTKNYNAEGTINGRRFVKYGAADGGALLAAANTDLIFGISHPMAAHAQVAVSGDRFDVDEIGEAEIELGGTVAAGDLLTSDANGKAVKITDVMLQAGPVNCGAQAKSAGVSGDYIKVTIRIQRITKYDVLTASAAELNTLDGAPLDASFVIGAEAADVINVGIQLKDADGADIAVRGNVFAYLSDDANGDSVAGTAPDGGVAVGTDGLAIPVVAGKAFELISEADGDIDLDITESAGATWYLILVLPNGKLVASGAITFEA